jgi:hypothetical protein
MDSGETDIWSILAELGLSANVKQYLVLDSRIVPE